MKLQFPFIQLPLSYEADALAAEVAAIDEAFWRAHPQKFQGNSMLPLVAVNSDPANESFSGPMRPTQTLQSCPYLMQVIESFGAVVGRSRLMRLSGHAEVSSHVDQGYYWAERVRVHVPILTQPTVRFDCGGTTVNMAAGECWIFDTWRPHNVINDAVDSRIHLVVDTVGGDAFWDLVAQGRPVPRPPGMEAWLPRTVMPRGDARPALVCETVNVPAVMTPWELNAQFGMLFGEAEPHPQLARVQEAARRFVRTWRSLWARYGESAQGHSHFRASLDRFLADMAASHPPILLRNGVDLQSTLRIRLEPSAVAGSGMAVLPPPGMSDRG